MLSLLWECLLVVCDGQVKAPYHLNKYRAFNQTVIRSAIRRSSEYGNWNVTDDLPLHNVLSKCCVFPLVITQRPIFGGKGVSRLVTQIFHLGLNDGKRDSYYSSTHTLKDLEMKLHFDFIHALFSNCFHKIVKALKLSPSTPLFFSFLFTIFLPPLIYPFAPEHETRSASQIYLYTPPLLTWTKYIFRFFVSAPFRSRIKRL